jgi:hypothetical protein
LCANKIQLDEVKKGFQGFMYCRMKVIVVVVKECNDLCYYQNRALRF